MGQHILKNIDFENALDLSELVSYQQGQVVSRTLVQNKAVSITLFSFDDNEEISSHSSSGDAMIMVLEGKSQITIGDKVYSVSAGETIVMPSGISHAVAADGQFKMLLTVIFPV